ncbi:hypothetical protein [Ruegeria sp. THAF33]|uniref:hypothetical protein n=1 Tax=Ruegeria sp. THAF33 TaxID=2587853 RepID=UPI001267D4C8|nr:hypothetical protein [Ruegeria sp. THAF33]QFT71500.1 hypothetical protein FIU92_00545 [Ruegeria sp. THAF33]
MASFGGFIRKSPSDRLRRFFSTRNVSVPDDFDWSSNGRGTALVKSVEELLAGLPERQQDAVKAELDLLASLADKDGMTAAEQVCAGQNIDIEGLAGIQEVLLFLAIDHPTEIDRVSVQASMLRRNGGRNWAAFQFDDDRKPWDLNSQIARDAFLTDTVAILDLPNHRKRVADWFETVRVHPITGEATTLTQATIYVEERAESELGFGPSATLERHVVPKVLEVGIACDVQARVVEISAKGGKKARDQYARAFSKHFAPHSEAPVQMPRRDVMLDILKQAPDFDIEPADGIERIEVSSLEFHATGGGYVRIEKRGEGESVYQFIERRFGHNSPLRAGGWQILAATVRIILTPTDGQRRRTLTVTLRLPNTTTLPNKTEKDRQFVFNLLERWGLLAAPHADFDVVEVA